MPQLYLGLRALLQVVAKWGGKGAICGGGGAGPHGNLTLCEIHPRFTRCRACIGHPQMVRYNISEGLVPKIQNSCGLEALISG